MDTDFSGFFKKMMKKVKLLFDLDIIEFDSMEDNKIKVTKM